MNEVEFKQREYDGKWEMIQKVLDHDNTYYITSESGNRVAMVPEKWITTGVYDYLIEMED
jgi:hypothetical protein